MREALKKMSKPNILFWISVSFIALVLSLGVVIATRDENWIRILIIVLTSVIMLVLLAYLVIALIFVGADKLGRSREEHGSIFKRYFKDQLFRIAINNSLSCIYIIISAYVNFVMAFFSFEWYFLLISAIFFIIFVMRLYLIVRINRDQNRQNIVIGSLLVVMSAAILGVLVLFMLNRTNFTVIWFMIYWDAFYTIVSTSSAIAGIVRTYRVGDELVERFLAVKLANAIFSMFTLLVSIVLAYSNVSSQGIKVLCMAAGIVTVVVILLASVLQFLQFRNKDKEFYDEPEEVAEALDAAGTEDMAPVEETIDTTDNNDIYSGETDDDGFTSIKVEDIERLEDMDDDEW